MPLRRGRGALTWCLRGDVAQDGAGVDRRSTPDASRAGGTKVRASLVGELRGNSIGAAGAGAGEMVAALHQVGMCRRAAETAGKTQRKTACGESPCGQGTRPRRVEVAPRPERCNAHRAKHQTPRAPTVPGGKEDGTIRCCVDLVFVMLPFPRSHRAHALLST